MALNDDNIPSSSASVPVIFVRVADTVREAPEADQAVAHSYPSWRDKGAIVGGRRLTILTEQLRARLRQEVRIVHVAEAFASDAVLYTMGPKAVLGEYVDAQLTTEPGPDRDDPLRPSGLYDGPVVPGPAVDYGYEVSVYRFESAGQHRIVWRLGPLVSNEIVISVE